MKNRKIGFASDHAGFALKNSIMDYLKDRDYELIDYGCFTSESCDYADYAHPLANDVESDNQMIGIVCCGSGNGINMTVNKHAKIRSAICWNTEIAILARSHNDANICSLPARFIEVEEALKVVDLFLSVEFENGRHSLRIAKIPIA